MPLQIRRGTDAERTAMTQPLAAGELIFVTNTNRLYIGNGTTNGGVPVTDYTDEQAKDAVAPMLVNGTHSAISFVYDDALDKVNATVNLSDYQGVIKAASFNGSVVANDSSLLIDGNTGKFNLSGSVGSNIIPDTDVAYDLGSATYRFRDLYLSGSSIKLGAATITATGTAVNLPAGSTIGGSAIGIPGGHLNVNIVADDSTVIVNTTTEVVTAQGGFVGNVTGNLTGNVTGNLTGNVTGTVTGNAGSVTNGVYTTDTGTVTNTMLAGSIVDTKLSTINTAGKVSNSATTATDANTGGTIVSRDGTGNFLANLITSNLLGNVTGNVTGNVSGNVTGNVTGNIFTTLIDSADSSAITITPAAIFSSDATVENNLTVNNIAAMAKVSADYITVSPGASNGFVLDVNNSGLEVKTGFGSYVNIEGQSFASDAYALLRIRGSRYSGTNRIAVQNLDDLGIITFEGYNGTEFKKSATLLSEVVSTISAGNFDSNLVVSVLNADGNYRQFKFLSSGIFDAGTAIQLLPIPDAALATVPAAEGQFGYGSDRKSLAFYNGSAFTTIPSFVAVPASKTASGKQGQVSADANYFYICYSTNNWIRVAKDATW